MVRFVASPFQPTHDPLDHGAEARVVGPAADVLWAQAIANLAPVSDTVLPLR